MIKKYCDLCGKEIREAWGSIQFRHQVGNAPEITAEEFHHVCPGCFGKMKIVIKGLK